MTRFCDITHELLQLRSCWGIQVQLQQVLNAAAHIVSDTWKYDRGLSHLLHDELHWLDVSQRVQYKLCATVHRCLQHKVPQ